MKPTCTLPRLVFPEGFTDRDEWEMERKGFVHAFLECEDGRRYQVLFIDPVRLAQDVLEVLALVAYLQPISQPEVESHGKANAGNLLRQLLRRDLISFERGPGGRKDLQYQTTPRFLSVFGLASLDDLPQAEDLVKK